MYMECVNWRYIQDLKKKKSIKILLNIIYLRFMSAWESIFLILLLSEY